MKKILLLPMLILFIHVNSQTELAKDKIYHQIDSIKAANPDSVFKIMLGGFSDDIKRFPRCILKCKNLSYLFIPCHTKNMMCSKSFKHLPRKIKNLKHLKTLEMAFANFGKIPKYLCELDSLECLIFHWCTITSLPETIGKLQNLKSIDIVDNCAKKMHAIPKSIENLKQIKNFEIMGCYFTKDSISIYKKRLPADCRIFFSGAIDNDCQ
jgi:Leucine-rich repeat (LRR) protein